MLEQSGSAHFAPRVWPTPGSCPPGETVKQSLLLFLVKVASMNSPHPLGPTLELIRGGRTERVYELKGPDLHIGRIPGLDVYLDDARVSRHHARVEHRPDGTSYLVDLESKSCTQLDGRAADAVPSRFRCATAAGSRSSATS